MRALLATTTLKAANCDIRAWSEPGEINTPMQDSLHWSLHANRILRLAAIDGCTPMEASPQTAGVNSGTYAAALINAALGEKKPVPTILAETNSHLVGLAPKTIAAARPSATVAAVDLENREEILHATLWVGGDAQIWALIDTEWELVGGGSGCSHETKETWQRKKENYQKAGMSFNEIQQKEAEHYNNPDLFIHHAPIGRFAAIKLQKRQLTCKEIIVATDGALLQKHACRNLETWIKNVREIESRGVSRLKPKDDIAIIHAKPAARRATG